MSKTTKPSWQDNDALLTYRVGPVLCCGPTLPVITITPPPSLTHLPGTNIAEPGIFKHGSYIVSATDLRYRFGVKQENWKQPGQVIIAQHGDLTRGYYVDEIKDVIHFPETGWGQLPAYLPRGIFSRTLLLENQIYLYTEFEKLSQLQGSGYLAEYISRLEEIKQSEDMKQSDEIKPREKYKTSLKSNLNISQPTGKNNIPDSNTANDSTLTKQSTNKILDETHSENSSTIIQSTDTSKSNNPLEAPEALETSDNLNSKKDSSPDTLIKDTSETKISSTDNDKSVKPEETFSTPEKNNTETIPVTKPKQEKPDRIDAGIDANIDPGIENKSSSPIKKNASQEQTTSSLAGSSTNIEPHKVQNIKPIPSKPAADREAATHKKFLKKDEPLKTEGSYAGLFIILLVLLTGAGGGYYYISHSTKVEDVAVQTTNVVSTSSQTSIPVINDSSQLMVETIKPETSKINLTTPIPITSEPKSIDVPEQAENKSDGINFEPILNQEHTTESSNTEIKNDEYHASIKQDQDTITIELDGPLPPAIKNSSTSVIDSNSEQKLNQVTNEMGNIKSDSLEIKPSDPLLPKPGILKPTIPEPDNTKRTKSVEIIHIIIKGDTLWAIAKHYLLNPFRYPELAKLSKIKNPDLIYPGKRVRIIYKDTSNKE